MAFLSWFCEPSFTCKGPNIWDVDLNSLWTFPFFWADFHEPFWVDFVSTNIVSNHFNKYLLAQILSHSGLRNQNMLHWAMATAHRGLLPHLGCDVEMWILNWGAEKNRFLCERSHIPIVAKWVAGVDLVGLSELWLPQIIF